MLFKEYLNSVQNQPQKRTVLFKKNTRKTLAGGRKEKLAYNPRLDVPIIGSDPHAEMNRKRRYKRRAKRLGVF
jgi:hypothetical protein